MPWATCTSSLMYRWGDKKGSKSNNSFKEAKKEAKALWPHQKLEERVKACLVLKTRKTPGVLSQECGPGGHGMLEPWAGPPAGLAHCLRELSSSLHWKQKVGTQDHQSGPRGDSRNKTTNNTKP